MLLGKMNSQTPYGWCERYKALSVFPLLLIQVRNRNVNLHSFLIKFIL